MRIKPTPAFVAKLLDALPADGTPISSRGIFVAIGNMATPAYVRIVLRELDRSGLVTGSGHPSERVYRRLQPQMEVA